MGSWGHLGDALGPSPGTPHSITSTPDPILGAIGGVDVYGGS